MRLILLTALLLPLASGDAQEFHTSPFCWETTRIYASGTTEHLQIPVAQSVESAAEIQGTPSPNGAYRFDITKRAKDTDLDWRPRLIVFNERPYLLEIQFPSTRAIAKAEWINENLIYVRLWWGRVAGSDFIVDVENETVVYQQPIRWGDTAVQQFRQCADNEWKDEEQCQCFQAQGGSRYRQKQAPPSLEAG